MDMRLYSLSGRDRDETKVSYLLDLGMGMRMNFFYRYEIMKPVPVSLPSIITFIL